MEEQVLYQTMDELMKQTPTAFHRYMYYSIPWHDRMIGLIGPRGVGKSTLLLQRIKEQQGTGKYLYVSADNLYFSNHTLVDLADRFELYGGTHLFIDEVHKYPNWSRELKNIYDSHPSLHIVFTGSSVLDILHGEADLSRRVLLRRMQGLSFREYLEFKHGIVSPVRTLDEILNNNIKLEGVEHPMPLFRDYLQNGYYPFSKETGFYDRLQRIVSLTMDVDIPQYADLRPSTAHKLKLLLTIITSLAPYKPNMSKLAAEIGVSKNNIQDYLVLLERAGMIGQLRDSISGLRLLGKVEKVYLDNPTLMYALSETTPDIGNVRETFFYNQMRVNHVVTSSKESDFKVGKYTFEVGGRNKGSKQIEGISDAYIVKDEIESAYLNVVPLWAFGLNY